MLTKDELEHLRELEKQSFPEPWLIEEEVISGDDLTWHVQTVSTKDGVRFLWGETFNEYTTDNNLELVVAMRNSVPSLLAHIEEQEKVIQRLVKVLEPFAKMFDNPFDAALLATRGDDERVFGNLTVGDLRRAQEAVKAYGVDAEGVR